MRNIDQYNRVSGDAHVIKGVAFVTKAAFEFHAECPVRKIRDSLSHQSPTVGGSDVGRGLSQGENLAERGHWQLQGAHSQHSNNWKMMLNPDVDGYTKTPNRPKYS